MSTTEPSGPVVRTKGIFGRLYDGETDIDFIGRMRLWFLLSAVLLAIGFISLFTRGLNLGIDFEGGVVWEVPVPESVSVADTQDAVRSLAPDANVKELTGGEVGREMRVEAEPLGRDTEAQVTTALAELGGVEVEEVNLTSVGPSWGDEITSKAQRALVVFLVLITLYITLRFEFRMAMATLAALFHDILFTVGVYSVFQLEVTPATVVALLTILGYSIYDGIVVFDRIDENTRLVSVSTRVRYRDMVNRSLNEVLMRTLNTSITALIPILSLLLLGSFLLGAETLQYFGLALFVGLAAGAYSSIFIASPVLVLLKEREPRFRDVDARIEAREEQALPSKRRRPGRAAGEEGSDDEADEDDAGDAPASEGAGGARRSDGARRTSGTAAAGDGPVQPRPRKVKKRRR